MRNTWGIDCLSTALVGVALLARSGHAEDTAGDWSAYAMQPGQFEGTWESLEEYECPEWFRDAKFGIWAIIGPQCVPMQGDWYGRHMYIQGHRQYEHHVKTYGHPSKFGYKDLIEKFDPKKLDFDKLVGLYKQAGAKYAVILAVHHDNFDLWNSRHHEWNSVKKGPRRDLVGEFRDAAAKHDIRFGVTTHLARVEKKASVDKSNIGYWDSASDWVSWRVKIPKAGVYHAVARISSAGRATPFAVDLDDQRIKTESIRTRSWDEFVPVEIGRFQVDKPRIHTLSVKPLSRETWAPIGLLEVKLVPVSK